MKRSGVFYTFSSLFCSKKETDTDAFIVASTGYDFFPDSLMLACMPNNDLFLIGLLSPTLQDDWGPAYSFDLAC